jgi:hypothetical protein
VLPDPLEAPEFEEWLEARDPQIREDCRFAIESSLELDNRRTSVPEIRVTLTDHPRWTEPAEMSLDAALRFLTQPLDVVVEDSLSDGAFLRAVADPHQRRALDKALEKQWLRFDNGGGIPNMLRRLKDQEAQQERTRRSFWIFDSDALAPGLPAPESQQLAGLCRRKRVTFHQLGRRSAESYLPVPVLTEVWANEKEQAARRKKARAFARLNEIRRHHFNMRAGFSGDESRLEEYERGSKKKLKIAQAVKELLEGLDESLMSQLASGFGDKISELFTHHRVLREDPWFESDGLREETRPLIAKLLAHC